MVQCMNGALSTILRKSAKTLLDPDQLGVPFYSNQAAMQIQIQMKI